MKTINSQSKELSGLVEIKIAFAASNSLLGHNGPFNAPEEQTTRTYITMSRDSQRHQATNKPTVYALAVEYRLLYTLIVYYLAPRDLHHDDPIEVDLYLMFTLKENVRIDWPHLLLLNMLGFSTSSDALGYLILISRIIEHALVDYHALDEANNDEAEEDDEEEVEEDPSEYSDSD
ncbi:hypothetical protein Lal_00043339 [Lupinus albus]|nr:hypothetical protein Lal_00043339 [Lupinus albus]